jgi:hypothetical protein
MVDIKHPYRKILSQEEIDAKEKAYEEKQKKLREDGFEAQEKKAKLKKEAEDKGWSRIIITENPREPEPKIIEKAKEEILVEEIEDAIEKIDESLEEVEEPIKIEEEKPVIIDEVKEAPSDLELKPPPEPDNKQRCPECDQYFTKGGEFAKHYQSHFNGD